MVVSAIDFVIFSENTIYLKIFKRSVLICLLFIESQKINSAEAVISSQDLQGAASNLRDS